MRLLLPVAAIATLMLAAGSAAAQPGAQPPPPPPPSSPMPPPPPPGPPPNLKSTGTGVGLAVAGSVVPAIAFGIGLGIDDNDTQARVIIFSVVGGLILPSSGYYYAGKKKSPGQYSRGLALIALMIGALTDGLGEDKEAGQWYGITGGLYGLGCLIDIAFTPSAVRDHNARVSAAPAMTIAPTVVPGGAGFALSGTF